MFTGIIRQLGVVAFKRGQKLGIRASIGKLERGASVAVNGTCLTAVRRSKGSWEFDVSPETLSRTNLGSLEPGAKVNLELPLRASDALGGHLVSGHVDSRARVLELEPLRGGFARLRVELPKELRKLVALKGSIAVDGVSLTVSRLKRGFFEAQLVPETLAKSNLGDLKPGDLVNLEADLIARYLRRMLA